MKNKIIALVILGGILGAWFWHDYTPRAAEVGTPAPPQESLSGQRAKLVNTDREGEYSIVLQDSLGQVVQVLGPVDLRDVISVGVMPRVEAQDANFDGFDDLRIQTCLGATGNACYGYWLFDAFTGLYVHHEGLSALGNPTLDKEEKRVISRWNDGCAGFCFTKEVYEYREGVLTLIARESQAAKDANQNVFVNTREELKDGKLVVVATVDVPLPQ